MPFPWDKWVPGGLNKRQMLQLLKESFSADRAIWADDDKSRIGLNRLHLRVGWSMSDAKSVMMLKVWQFYRLRAEGIEDSAGGPAASAKESARP